MNKRKKLIQKENKDDKVWNKNKIFKLKTKMTKKKTIKKKPQKNPENKPEL